MKKFRYVCPHCNKAQTEVISGESLTGKFDFKEIDIIDSDFKKLCWYDFTRDWKKCPSCNKEITI